MTFNLTEVFGELHAINMNNLSIKILYNHTSCMRISSLNISAMTRQLLAKLSAA